MGPLILRVIGRRQFGGNYYVFVSDPGVCIDVWQDLLCAHSIGVHVKCLDGVIQSGLEPPANVSRP